MSDKVTVVKLQAPVELAVMIPIWLVLSNTVTGRLASAEPVSFTEPFAFVVMLAYVGGAGATRSRMNDSLADAALVFPATSIAIAETKCVPSLLKKIELGVVQMPLAGVVMLLIRVAPSNTCTMLPASAVPEKVGVETLVMLSVLDVPLSEAAVRSGVVGAFGATVSIVTDSDPDVVLARPANPSAWP